MGIKGKPFDKPEVLQVQRIKINRMSQRGGGNNGVWQTQTMAESVGFQKRQGDFRSFLVNCNLMKTGEMLLDLCQFAAVPCAVVEFANGYHAYSKVGNADLPQA